MQNNSQVFEFASECSINKNSHSILERTLNLRGLEFANISKNKFVANISKSTVYENKSADQLHCNCAADQCHCVIVQSVFFLNPYFQACRCLLWLNSAFCVKLDRKPQTDFLLTRLIGFSYLQIQHLDRRRSKMQSTNQNLLVLEKVFLLQTVNIFQSKMLSLAFVSVFLDCKMSQVMRKPCFLHMYKQKQRLAAQLPVPLFSLYSTIPLLPKSEILYLNPSSAIEQPCLYWTWSKTKKTGFLMTRLKCVCNCHLSRVNTFHI